MLNLGVSGEFEDGEYANKSSDAQHGERSGLHIVQFGSKHAILHEQGGIEWHHCQEVEDVQDALQELNFTRTREKPAIKAVHCKPWIANQRH